MKVFTCNDHNGYWPVGTASVIVAEDKDVATRLLDVALKDKKLKPSELEAYTLVELDTRNPGAFILNDGN